MTRIPANRPWKRCLVWLPLGWLALVTAGALAAPWLPLQAPERMNWDHLAVHPGSAVRLDAGTGVGGPAQRAWLGTDTLGRDVLARVVHGARVSLSVGVLSPLAGLILGGLLGTLAGYFRGRLDAVTAATMDVVLSFPGIVLLLGVTFYFGAGLGTLIPTLGFLTVPAFCRVARAATLRLSGQDFVTAARSLGQSHGSILLREILPNIASSLLVYALLVMAVMIVAEGAMSFLGLGVPPPTPSWGGMIAEGREVLDEAPHISLVPAGVLFLTVLSLNLLGDGLRSRARAARQGIR